MGRMMHANVIATSGRAVEAAGDCDVLLLDKTGTITLGNRQATVFFPADGVSETSLADAAQLASLADETPEGRSIVDLAHALGAHRGREVVASLDEELKAAQAELVAHGRTIEVAVSRIPATRPALRRGVLVVNPGGPGAPGSGSCLGLASPC